MSLGLVSGSTPWGGAATRAISVMHLDAGDYFVHIIPSLIITGLFIVGAGFVMGMRERKRIDKTLVAELAREIELRKNLRSERPTWQFWVNLTLTVLLLTLLVLDVAPLVILFMVAFVIALLVNYPKLAEQSELIKTHASSAVPVVMLVLAAGIFTGILTESGMIQAMADSILAVVPESLGAAIPLITALISIPLAFFMSNDAFFFGILPVLAESAAHYGTDPVEIARAGVIGQMAHMIGPASAPLWVLLGLLKKELGEFQKFAIGWVAVTSLVFTLAAVVTGAISAPF
jgi:CitMHS family citrate-Mg2+:H+ or citrate-Ca2+:H+ symporter